MLRLISAAAVMLALGVFGAGFYTVGTHTVQNPLARAEPGSRIAAANMLVFLSVGKQSQQAGYLDGRPVPSGVTMPIIVHVKPREASNAGTKETTQPVVVTP
jgi:hypothetical protein